MKQIAFRFANPRMVGSKLRVSVQAIADEPMNLFAINLRFLYDGRLFKPYSKMNEDFKIIPPPGYTVSNPFNGNSATLWGMFGATGPMTYINTAVTLTTKNAEIPISDDPMNWSGILDLEFTPISPLPANCCASFIWDKKTIANQNNAGGYLGQGDGLTITELVGYTPAGDFKSAATVEFPNHLNWTPNTFATRYPWGVPNANNCFPL